MRIYKLVGIVLSALLLLVSCTNSDVDKKKVKIAYANWLEGIAMSHLVKVVLEEQGYEVELQNADLAPIFVSMSGKKSDVFLDAWLPITMKDYNTEIALNSWVRFMEKHVSDWSYHNMLPLIP